MERTRSLSGVVSGFRNSRDADIQNTPGTLENNQGDPELPRMKASTSPTLLRSNARG